MFFSKHRLKNSIATKLLKVSFSFYFILTLTVTLIHMFSDYYYTKQKIIEEIVVINETYQSGLASAIWDFNYNQLNQLASGMIKFPIIIGVHIKIDSEKNLSFGTIQDEQGNIFFVDENANRQALNESKKLLEFNFDINFNKNNKKIYLGNITFFTNHSTILERLKVGFLFLVVNAIIKTIALWIIFLLIARYILIRPLSILTRSASQINLDNLDSTRIDLKTSGKNELKTLEKVFNLMIEKLLTDRKKIQEYATTLKKKNYELTELDRIKDEILANTSHELRTPLNGIIGIADSLLDDSTGQLTDEQKRNLSLISNSGRRLSRLVNNILDFSKLNNQDYKINKQSIHLHSATEVVMMLSKPHIKNKDIRLLNQINKDINVDADENCIMQILHNLIGNAIKFTESGKISASCKETNDSKVIITITDTGIGIPKNKFQSIFKSFEQADGSIVRKYGGTGLGLAITSQLIQLHSGEIWLESEPDKGSKFHFTLKKSISNEKAVELSDMLNNKSKINQIYDDYLEISTKKINTQELDISDKTDQVMNKNENKQQVLIIDDEPVNIQVIMNQLSNQNYILIPALDAKKGIEIINSNQNIDIVLLDIMMPEISGYEVCKHIRKKYNENELPVIMLTAKNQISDLVTGFKVGANDYLTKPFNKEELKSRVASHLRIKKLVSENMHMKAELDIVRQLQQMILPSETELNLVKNLDIDVFMRPADNVSGDYFDIIQLDNTIKFGIGDVSGHGLKSGVLMLMLQSIIRTMVTYGVDNSVKFLNVINRVIYDNINRIKANKDLSLSIFDYSYDENTKTGHLTICGQHEDVIVIRKDGSIEIENTYDLGFPIGLEKDISSFIAESHILLNEGDGVVLFTDGITEAFNIKDEMYGMDRFCNVIKNNWQKSISKIKQEILNDIMSFIGKQIIYDDIMFIIIKQK